MRVLGKDFDRCFVGSHYSSYLMGLDALRRGESVFVLDDPKIQFGKFFAGFLPYFEKHYLDYVFQGLELRSFDDFCLDKECSLLLDLEGVRLRLGRSLEFNLLELNRKCNLNLSQHFFEKKTSLEMLENVFEQAVQKKYFLTETSGEVGQLRNIFSSKIFSDLYKEFFESQVDGNPLYTHLIQFIRVITRFSIAWKKDLFLANSEALSYLCSPWYMTHADELKKYLREEFINRGGETTCSSTEDLRIEGKEIESLQLASYQGVVRPSETIILGNIFHEYDHSSQEEQILLISKKEALTPPLDCEDYFYYSVKDIENFHQSGVDMVVKRGDELYSGHYQLAGKTSACDIWDRFPLFSEEGLPPRLYGGKRLGKLKNCRVYDQGKENYRKLSGLYSSVKNGIV